jgi:VIT1/CCC1 family predicted Fe2+/Mn2+ transporter
MVGLSAGTGSKLAVLGGIFTIAIADAFSDALGIHISEESEGKHTTKEIWESTGATFASKLVFALTFVIPVLLFTLQTAVIISIVWGLSALAALSYILAKDEGRAPWKVILEHMLIALVVIAATHYVGEWIARIFS